MRGSFDPKKVATHRWTMTDAGEGLQEYLWRVILTMLTFSLWAALPSNGWRLKDKAQKRLETKRE